MCIWDVQYVSMRCVLRTPTQTHRLCSTTLPHVKYSVSMQFTNKNLERGVGILVLCTEYVLEDRHFYLECKGDGKSDRCAHVLTHAVSSVRYVGGVRYIGETYIRDCNLRRYLSIQHIPNRILCTPNSTPYSTYDFCRRLLRSC